MKRLLREGRSMRNSRPLILLFALAVLAGETSNELWAGAGTGLSYSQITEHLESYFTLERSTPVHGETF